MYWLQCVFCSVTKSCPTLCNPMATACQAPLSSTLSEFAQIHVHWVSDAFQPSHPLSPLSPFAFTFFPASVSFPVSRLFTIRWPMYWSFSFRSVLQMNIQGWFPLGLMGLISFAVQGSLKSLLSNYSSKASILWHSACDPTLLSIRDYWKIIALTIRTFVGKVTSLLINTLSRFVIASLWKSKHLLISWLQSLYRYIQNYHRE